MKKSNNRILVIDDNEDVLLAAKLLLKQHFNIIDTEKDPGLIPELLKNEVYDMTSGQEGFYWLNEILKIDPSSVVILITSFGDVDTAVQAIKLGATDFVLKPWQNEKFVATISSAVKLSESRRELDYLHYRKFCTTAACI